MGFQETGVFTVSFRFILFLKKSISLRLSYTQWSSDPECLYTLLQRCVFLVSWLNPISVPLFLIVSIIDIPIYVVYEKNHRFREILIRYQIFIITSHSKHCIYFYFTYYYRVYDSPFFTFLL